MSEPANGTRPPETPEATSYGDLGQTTFGETGDIPKSDIRLTAYGACEEANATIGMAMAFGGVPVHLVATLASLQDDLYDLEADLSTPPSNGDESVVRIVDAHIARLDRASDHYASGLQPVEGFVLPGGTVTSALLFQARSFVRRAERAVWTVLEEYPSTNPLTARYLNRLSSLLFILARAANSEHGDTMWRPGASVATPEEAADQRS